jgi:hypothetical protein
MVSLAVLTQELVDGDYATKALTEALRRVIAAEPDITRYDTIVGDGDCGIGLKRGAEGTWQSIECSRVLTLYSNPGNA